MDPINNFTFKGDGHQQPGRKPSNLYVNLQLAPPNPASKDYAVQCRYMRVRNDLIYRHKITLQDAIKCRPVKVPLLDGRTVLLALD